MLAQDIKRNELLDKIAEGWSLRKKAWNAGVFLKADTMLSVAELLAEDWEGKPPRPKTVRLNQDIFLDEAISQAKPIKAFIKHKLWPEGSFMGLRDGLVHLDEYCEPIDFLLELDGTAFATPDWEVWTFAQQP